MGKDTLVKQKYSTDSITYTVLAYTVLYGGKIYVAHPYEAGKLHGLL
jgi:hypothetical protein